MTLRDKMLAVCADVNAQVAEREELVELIAIALLTRKNLFLLGAPGQAKSYAINAFRSRIDGARQFERLLSKQTDEEQLFGRVDLSSLIPGSVPRNVLEQDPQYQRMRDRLRTQPSSGQGVGDLPEQMERHRKALAELHGGEPQVNTAGKIPEVDIVFLDECFKANDGVLNSPLTALNERKYTNEGRTYPIPTISFFAASNEIPNFADPQEKILEALYDRLELKVVTENISDRAKRLAVLRDKQAGRSGQISASFTLDELKQMQEQVSAIPVPDSVNELADDILCELRKGGVPVSDRKYLNYYPIAQAKAWLSGHVSVEPIDLLAMKNYLWQKPGDRPTVEATLNRMCVNPMQDKVNGIRAMALEAQGDFDAARQDASKPSIATRALQKLRGELVRLYGMQQDLANAVHSDSERTLTDGLLADLEQINRQASEAISFTYVPLEQLAAMQ
ncbi:MAG: AAA domain-containing protein [Oscillibacter sp.]|nr:AAA domain-containing protein [Oscillibacter sp.]